MNMSNSIRLVAFLCAPFLVFGEVIEVDVGAWADVGTGTTNGWEVSGIDRYSEKEGGFTRLNAKDDYVISPDFANVVTQVVMGVRSSNATMTRFLALTPTVSDSAARQWEAVASKSLTNETFTWSQSEGVRRFRLQNENGSGSGSWGIASLAVYTDRIEPPTELREDALYRDAFAAAWNPTPEAVRYQVRYASVTRMPPRYETVAEWDFSSVTNTSGNTRELEALRKEFPDALEGVTGTSLGLQGHDGGHLQVGKSDGAGAMELQLDATVKSRTCLITNWRHGKDKGSGCSAFCLCADGSTNAVVSLTAGVNPATDVFAMPDATCTLRVESPASRRVEILSVIVAADYVPDAVTTNRFNSVVTRGTGKTLTGLRPGEWLWSVRSFDADGQDSPWSSFRTVVLDASNPPNPLAGFGILVK